MWLIVVLLSRLTNALLGGDGTVGCIMLLVVMLLTWEGIVCLPAGIGDVVFPGGCGGDDDDVWDGEERSSVRSDAGERSGMGMDVDVDELQVT